MSSAVQHEAPLARAARISVLVSSPEAAQIANDAQAAGLSVSAFLRGRALGLAANRAEEEAMRQVDALLDKMSREVEGAIDQVASALARLNRS